HDHGDDQAGHVEWHPAARSRAGNQGRRPVHRGQGDGAGPDRCPQPRADRGVRPPQPAVPALRPAVGMTATIASPFGGPFLSPPPVQGRVRVGGTRWQALTILTPHPNPPPQGGRGKNASPSARTSTCAGPRISSASTTAGGR